MGAVRLAVLGIIAPIALAGAQVRLVPVDIRLPKAPTAVWSGGRANYVYEFRVTNVGRKDIALQRVAVSSGGTVLATWSGDTLKTMTLAMGGGPDGRVIPAGRQSLLYLLVTTANAVPILDHQLLFTNPDSLAGVATDTVADYRVATETIAPVAIRAPLRGGPWVAANGPGNASGHRRTVIPLDGVARIPQRFATDWVRVGTDGKLWQGDSTKNENWYGHGQPLLAVGPGTVVAIKDGIPENVPLAPNRAVPITLETVGGNHVIIDLGGGRYGFYAHMIPGSLKVKIGDQVKAGDVVGLLGNSGNSDAPHLHFHVGDAPSPLGTEGLPFSIDQYWVLGVANEFLMTWKASGPESTEERAIPFENQVVRFRP